MSKQEFSRLEVLLRVQSGGLRVPDACVLIGLQRRQVFRLLRGLKQDGATSLLSKRRGRPSNHRLPAEVRTLALSIVRERYADFGPTLAAEKLAEHHGCSVSRETLRGWMIADGLWQDRRHITPKPTQDRPGARVEKPLARHCSDGYLDPLALDTGRHDLLCERPTDDIELDLSHSHPCPI